MRLSKCTRNQDLDNDHIVSSTSLKIASAETEDINGNDFKCDQCSFSAAKKEYLKQHKEGYFKHRKMFLAI